MATPGFLNNLANALRDKLTPSVPLVGSPNPVRPEDRSLLNRFVGDRNLYERFSPDSQKQVATEYMPYLSSIGLGKNVKLGSDAFDTHLTNRVGDILKLTKAQTPQGDLIHEKLNNVPDDSAKKAAINGIKTELNNALKVADSSELVAAQKEYKESMVAFQKLLQGEKKHHAQDLIGLMEEITNKATDAIKKQQQKEIDKLDELFNDDAFKNNLITAFDIKADDVSVEDKLAKVKESLLADLKESHTKQLEEFDETTKKSKVALHKAAEQQLKSFLFMADLHKNDPKMRALIAKLAEMNEEHADNASIEISESKSNVFGVGLDQLKFIQRLGGGEIKQKIDDKGNPTYTLDMGMKFANPRYYFNDHHQKDMLTMAQAIRASGSQSITMTLTFSNERIAEERARQAFEACLKSGFPPEKIKLNVNGQIMVFKPEEKDGKNVQSIPDKLYNSKGNGHKLNTLLQNASTTREELKALDKTLEEQLKDRIKPTQGEALSNIRSELHKLRNQSLPQMGQTTPTTDPDNSPSLHA